MGSAINIPVKRLSRTESVPVDQLAVFGLAGWWPTFQRVRRDTIIAVNVGGCLVPVALAIYETAHLAIAGRQALSGLVVAVLINTGVCYWMAQPVEGVGIAMPGFFPAIVASLSAVLLVPDQAPPVAFVAGVLGPLIGTDLLHLREIEKIATGVAASAARGRSTESCSQESWRRIWHRIIHHKTIKPSLFPWKEARTSYLRQNVIPWLKPTRQRSSREIDIPLS